MQDTQEIKTKAEAAAYLKVHPRTLDRLVLAGKLNRIYLGPQSPRFTTADLNEFINSLRGKSTLTS